MDSIKEATLILVADFLRKTGRVLQAIEVYKECLIIVHSQPQAIDSSLANFKFRAIYKRIILAYDCIKDYTSTEKFLKELLLHLDSTDTAEKGWLHLKLAVILQIQNKLKEAWKFYESAINIMKTMENTHGQATCYAKLGQMFQSHSQYDKALEYQEKALAIRIEIGDRNGEATSYGNLGTLFQSLGQYDKAREYQEKALAITTEIGDREGESTIYANLGYLFQSLGQFDKAREYQEKALSIKKRIGDKNGEARIYRYLTSLFLSLGKYAKADDYLGKARAVTNGMNNRRGEAIDYNHLGKISQKRGEYDKAQEYFEKAHTICMEIGEREGVVVNYRDLGLCFQSRGKYDKAEEFLKQSLLLSRDIGHNLNEFCSLCNLSALKLSQCHREEASSYLLQAIEKFETLRGFLKENDQFQICLLETHGAFPYMLFSRLLSSTGKPQDALYVEELRRARGLANLMAARYSVQEQISSDPQSWCGIQGIITKEADCACLYISVGENDVRFWIIKATGDIHFSRKEVNLDSNEVPELDEFFKELMSFRNRPKLNDYDTEDFKRCLHLCYKIIIAPVASLLKQPEIIIVPDSCVYQVPFAALADEGGKYLSETYRIRLVPSLTTLKLVKESPPDLHSQTGALIVGDPVVGKVIYEGKVRNMIPSPCARKEAEMIGTLLGVTPLIGDSATKHSVLQAINSVSLIHIAAHGDAERGEIALSPEHPSPLPPFPREEDYLLTMADISKTRLRAKLVVLSCCHSARGQIRTEGVIGIARAFLGSGARSVLAARWALDDTATEQFMTCFYKHLFRGESASESLHKARKWMRNNGFDKVSQWAPFMIMGDNVTFDFGNWPAHSAP